jgi:hypothetical protein
MRPVHLLPVPEGGPGPRPCRHAAVRAVSRSAPPCHESRYPASVLPASRPGLSLPGPVVGGPFPALPSSFSNSLHLLSPRSAPGLFRVASLHCGRPTSPPSLRAPPLALPNASRQGRLAARSWIPSSTALSPSFMIINFGVPRLRSPLIPQRLMGGTIRSWFLHSAPLRRSPSSCGK